MNVFNQFSDGDLTILKGFCNFSRSEFRFPVFMSQKLVEINLEGG